MATMRHLRNAPITEALLDLRVKVPGNITPDSFKPLVEELREQFPKADQLKSMQAVFQVKQGITSSETSMGETRGYVLRSNDGLNIVQLRTDGFTFHRLKPYTSWEDIFPRAVGLWGHYIRSASPELVSRLAVRYINHIRLPGQSIDFEDYFTAGPTVPPELPQAIINYLIRVVIHDPGTALAANVIQAFEPPVDPAHTTVILDIDAYKVRDWNPTDPDIVETFELLHSFKNRLFFSHITEVTARLFE